MLILIKGPFFEYFFPNFFISSFSIFELEVNEGLVVSKDGYKNSDDGYEYIELELVKLSKVFLTFGLYLSKIVFNFIDVTLNGVSNDLSLF